MNGFPCGRDRRHPVSVDAAGCGAAGDVAAERPVLQQQDTGEHGIPARIGALAQQNPQFTLITLFSDDIPDPQTGTSEQGHITAALLSKYLSDPAKAEFYVAGPPAMVTDMERILIKARVNRKDKHIERFAGY